MKQKYFICSKNILTMPTVNMFVESKLATLPACLWMRGQRWGFGQRAAECYTLHGQTDKMVGSWGPLVHDLWTTTVNQFPPPVRHYRQQLVISDPISSLYTLHHSSPIVTSMYIDIHNIYLKAQLKNLYEACTKNYALCKFALRWYCKPIRAEYCDCWPIRAQYWVSEVHSF